MNPLSPAALKAACTHRAEFPSDGHFPGLTWPVFELHNIRLEGRFQIPVLADGTRLDAETLGPGLGITNVEKARFRTTEVVELEGSFLPLGGRFDTNFYHWVSELLTNLFLAETLGLECTYLLPVGVEQIHYIQPFLKLLQVPESRLLIHPGCDLAVERYFLPLRLHGTTICRSTPFVGLLRERALKNLGVEPKPRRRILVSRRNAARRRTINEAPLYEMLADFGFEAVTMESLTLEDQVRLAASAEAFVFPHGAALVHQIFLPREAVAIEMFSPYYVTPHSQFIAHRIGNRYFHATYGIHQEFKTFASRVEAAQEDVEANLDFIRITLARELKSGQVGA